MVAAILTGCGTIKPAASEIKPDAVPGEIVFHRFNAGIVEGEVIIESMIRGDTVTEVLDYVEFHRPALVQRLQVAVEIAVREGRLTHMEAGHFLKFYEEALNGYTYLEEVHEPTQLEAQQAASRPPVTPIPAPEPTAASL